MKEYLKKELIQNPKVRFALCALLAVAIVGGLSLAVYAQTESFDQPVSDIMADKTQQEVAPPLEGEKGSSGTTTVPDGAPCKCQALFPLGGKHFFLDLGKHFFPWLGKHFFLLCGKEFFPCDGKYFFP